MPGYANNQNRQEYSSRPQGQQQSDWIPIEIKAIVDGNDPEKLVSEAQRLARALRGGKEQREFKEDKEATRTQIRRLFSTFRQIEFAWPRNPQASPGKQAEADRAYFEMVLMRPKLQYQAKRQPNLKRLTDTIDAGIVAVGRDRGKFERLMQFFEATVAYHTAN